MTSGASYRASRIGFSTDVGALSSFAVRSAFSAAVHGRDRVTPAVSWLTGSRVVRSVTSTSPLPKIVETPMTRVPRALCSAGRAKQSSASLVWPAPHAASVSTQTVWGREGVGACRRQAERHDAIIPSSSHNAAGNASRPAISAASPRRTMNAFPGLHVFSQAEFNDRKREARPVKVSASAWLCPSSKARPQCKWASASTRHRQRQTT